MARLLGIAHVCVVLTAQAIAQSDTSTKTTARPNILMIVVDDLNDWIGAYHTHPGTKTPNIDKLAEHGVLFTNAHCQAPLCGPSRASFMTGLLPSTTGIYGHVKDHQIRAASKPAESAVFLPDHFKAHGYTTIGAGKLFHIGDTADVFSVQGPWCHPDNYPISKFGPFAEERIAYDPSTVTDIGSTATDWGAYPDSDHQMPDAQIAAFGAEQIQKEHDAPFFMALGFIRPHVPFTVPAKWFEHHPIESVQLPPYLANDQDDVPDLARRLHHLPAMPTADWLVAHDQWAQAVQAYLACITFVDAQIGKVFDALAAGPNAQGTIVILFSDHGYHLGEKNRVCKQALWDRATRVPFIISTVADGPFSMQPGRCDAPVGLIDIYPTATDLCGLPLNPANEGHSLLPLIQNPRAAWPHTTLSTHGPNNHAVQGHRYRYYRYEDGSEELYDHQQDPNEWHNLSSTPGMESTKQHLAAELPKINAPTANNIDYPTNLYFQELIKREAATQSNR